MYIKKDKPRIHPAIPDLAKDLKNGNLDRREFLRTSTLLGLSAGAAYAMANNLTGIVDSIVPKARAQTPKAGGTLRVSMQVQEMTDPAVFDWVQKSNVSRHMNEFLTITGSDNITRPYLCEKWEASDDLKEWTFTLRKGIKWHNGDEFNAEDVRIQLQPLAGSEDRFFQYRPVFSHDRRGGYRREKRRRFAKNDQTCHRRRGGDRRQPHRDDTQQSARIGHPGEPVQLPDHDRSPRVPGNLSEEKNGTGPYTLTEFAIGERAVLKRTDMPYWGGEVYLDEIHYYDHGAESAAQMAALASGQVDSIYEFDIGSLQMAQNMPGFVIYEA